MTTPTIEFFVGLSEELSGVSLRKNKSTGIRNVLMTFKTLKAIERFQSFTTRTYGDLRLTDEEGVITVIPNSTKFIFGGDEGDEMTRDSEKAQPMALKGNAVLGKPKPS